MLIKSVCSISHKEFTNYSGFIFKHQHIRLKKTTCIYIRKYIPPEDFINVMFIYILNNIFYANCTIPIDYGIFI